MNLALWFIAVFAIGMMFGSAWDEGQKIGVFLGFILLVCVAIFAAGVAMAP